MPSPSVLSLDEDVKAKEARFGGLTAFMVDDEIFQDVSLQTSLQSSSLSDLPQSSVPQSSVSAVASPCESDEKNFEKTCNISGDGDAFGVSTTSDGQLQFSPLSLEAQDSWTISMNVLGTLTRPTSASFTSSSLPNGTSSATAPLQARRQRCKN